MSRIILTKYNDAEYQIFFINLNTLKCSLYQYPYIISLNKLQLNLIFKNDSEILCQELNQEDFSKTIKRT